MKLSKKFISAIAMLTLSAVMLTTSSFAWFSTNENVKATGMQVTAKGDQVFLQISNGDAVYDANGDAGTTNMFSDKASMLDAVAKNSGLSGGEAIKYLPVAVGSGVTNPTVDGNGDVTAPGSVTDLGATSGATLKWYTNLSKTTESSAASQDYEEVTANFDNYYLKNTFYLRLNPSAGLTTAKQPLTSKVALVGAPDEALAQAVSVVIVCGSYAQVWKQTALNTWALDGGDKQLTADKFTNPGSGEGVEVNVYIFFDGENANCKTANITATSYQVQINFDVATAVA